MNDYFGLLISIKTNDGGSYFGHYLSTTQQSIWLTEFTSDDRIRVSIKHITYIQVLGTEDILALLDCGLAVALALKERNK